MTFHRPNPVVQIVGNDEEDVWFFFWCSEAGDTERQKEKQDSQKISHVGLRKESLAHERVTKVSDELNSDKTNIKKSVFDQCFIRGHEYLR
jgi:hypothetical protein